MDVAITTAIFDQAAVGIAQIETQTGKFVRINQKYCDIVGYRKEEMNGATFMEITHPDDLQEDLDNMEKIKNGTINEFSMEKRYFHKNGGIVWVNLTVSPMEKKESRPTFHIAVVQDISRRKQAEAERRKLEKMLSLKNTELVRKTAELQSSLEEIKILKGIIPLCSYCHSIRDEGGAWDRFEAYLSKYTDAEFSHGICPNCLPKVRAESGLD